MQVSLLINMYMYYIIWVPYNFDSSCLVWVQRWSMAFTIQRWRDTSEQNITYLASKLNCLIICMLTNVDLNYAHVHPFYSTAHSQIEFPVIVRLRSCSGILKFCLFFTMFFRYLRTLYIVLSLVRRRLAKYIYFLFYSFTSVLY